ncbi:MAG: hypothetical protein WC648_02880 [Candidatus Paceibacterota bacterium]
MIWNIHRAISVDFNIIRLQNNFFRVDSCTEFKKKGLIMSDKDLGFNLKPGINYCTAKILGFRGIGGDSGCARLIPMSDHPEIANQEEMSLFFGVDILASLLPYIPDMGPESEFSKKGDWHYYDIENGIVIDHLTENRAGFLRERVLVAFTFTGEYAPRVFVDRRSELSSASKLNDDELREVASLLDSKGFAVLNNPTAAIH